MTPDASRPRASRDTPNGASDSGVNDRLDPYLGRTSSEPVVTTGGKPKSARPLRKSSGANASDNMTLWLVARPDGSLARVLRAASAKGAILGRFKDEDDPIPWGNVAAWRLGGFPEQFEITADKDGIVVREIGRPRV